MKRTATLVLALVIVFAPAALGAQMTAGDDPQVSGPLELEKKDCQRRTKSFNRDLAAVAKACLRFYSMAPDGESDEDRNYGAIWLQSNLDAKNGWCTLEVTSDILLPKGVQVHARVPRGVTEISRVRTRATRLQVDAAGAAEEQATIRQEAIAYPRVIRTGIRQDGQVFRLKWKGATAKTLGFPSGLEVSWPSDNTSADLSISFSLNYELRQSC